MAIRFKADLRKLCADLKSGGYTIVSAQPVPEARGRSIDVEIGDDTRVCWDKETSYLWVEGTRSKIEEVESFLRGIYEASLFRRLTAPLQSRWTLYLKKAHHGTASWLLRSEKPTARVLRRAIESVPPMPLKARRNSALSPRS